MFIKNLYVKKYTSILDFIQKEKIIQYGLCETIENDSVMYGIRVKSICKGECEEEFLLGISDDKVLIESIIRYLYENSLEVTNFKDVVSDLLGVKISCVSDIMEEWKKKKDVRNAEKKQDKTKGVQISCASDIIKEWKKK